MSAVVSSETLFLPIRELGKRFRNRTLSPVALTEAYLDRCRKLGSDLNAIATLTTERALKSARQAEQELAAGHDRGPLHGIPYAAKDLLAVAGYPTTWGAKPYADQRFDFDATAIARLDAAGAVLIAKAAMIELAGGLGYSGPYASLTGPCHNPWNTKHWSCGSSSGSGAMVAAGLTTFALGSDTRGSIICPATWCGVAGLRPSFGRVSRHGVMTIAWTMDKIGPLARTAEDAALVLGVMAGHDPKDWDSLPEAEAAFDAAASKPRPLRVGRLTNVFPNAQPEIHQAADRALDVLRAQGATVEDAEIPQAPFEEASELVILIEAASAFSELIASGRCQMLEDPLGQINGYASSAFKATDYIQLQRVRLELARKMDALFDRFDVVAAPGQGSTASLIPAHAPTGAPRPRPAEHAPHPPHGEHLQRRRAFRRDDLQPDGISSLCGLPAVTVPAGLSAQGLPMGVQFMGRALEDAKPLAAARLLQAHSEWHLKHPPMPYGV